MQVVLKQCNGLLKRVSSSTQAQCPTCLHGNWELKVSLVLFFSMFHWLVCEGWYFVPLGTISRTGPSDAKLGDLQPLGCNVWCVMETTPWCAAFGFKTHPLSGVFSFVGGLAKRPQSQQLRNHVSVFCVFGDKEWLVFTRSHVNLEPEFVIKTS